jgi:methionyl-tRNA synthetase
MNNMSITFDDFIKVEIRIGTIIDVEAVPDADKLLKLTVDLGEAEPRQIISGIKHLVADPSALKGRQSPFVANLEPRVIRGLESQGMILALGSDDEFTLLAPEKEVAPGTLAR